ncbi:helix-turn-helix transcriptional regulator [Saccharibacillus alkalitolerans]|uniref:Helix-turn-helix transcriptional regulator n=1 Tax=Saccharibacillus alkalitolerans TaxID=2705290 RepID=A0ABX0F2D2_9BACL|nr:AraC family transcriptional regulator [Saccharibacillus alkalitolerans]NGZ73784.1 helix-turn-helix transcriptional regulator [Saccharibacillus alkalitolerans]
MQHGEPVVYLAAPPFPYFMGCGRTVYAPGDAHPNRRDLGMFDLILVERGTLFIGEEERRWEVGAGRTLLLLPDRYHYSVRPCEEETAFVWIHFRALGEWGAAGGSEPTFADRELHASAYGTAAYTIRLPQFGMLPGAPGGSGEGERLLRLEKRNLSGAVWERQRLFEELLRSLDLRRREPSGSPAESVAERAERYIRSHYAETLTGASLSEALHFHYNYLTRCMKRVNGMTPMEYLEEYRLEQARLLLLRTEASVAAVAERVGFETAAYFSRRFARRFGISPLRFRQRHMR